MNYLYYMMDWPELQILPQSHTKKLYFLWMQQDTYYLFSTIWHR